MMYVRSILFIAVMVLGARAATAQHHAGEHGVVHFPISCSTDAAAHFETGLALMHHMMYEQAYDHFQQAADADSECAMAHWGLAMTQIHPLWAPPTPAEVAKGQKAAAKAASLGAPTERESLFIAAAGAFFEGDDAPFPKRLAAWEAGLQRVHEAHPDDVEAAAFYALSRLATAPKEDKTFAQQAVAGALLEKLLEEAPEHPGLFHYTIHAYDNPVLAERAVDIAHGYDKLAPDVPHALHMPSHIFVRLGYWQEVANWNERSAAAALRQPVGDRTSFHHAHALDYLAYAHLQMGQDDSAREIIAALKHNYQSHLGASYAFAATPARHALERGAWAEAAALPVRPEAGINWDDFPEAEAITHFARGIGAARSGDLESARASVESLKALHEKLVAAGNTYWAVHAKAQRKSVAAWLALAEGRQDEALELMKAAADLEDSVDKSPVTPSAVLPARELYGEMLLNANDHAGALAAYKAALTISPNRFNALFGAGRAAEKSGDHALAQRYYMDLANLASAAEAEREAASHAEAFLNGK